ncbi:4709_t:CDS:2, partial [Ambispora leptoticha]
MPYIPDSRNGIARHREEVMEIMSRGGGVGSNGSALRPRNSSVKSVGGRSSGSRRGAQMIMLTDWHPDIIEFIVAKVQNPHVLTQLMKNTQDKWIAQEIKNKLEFVKLSDQEEQMINIFLANNANDSRLSNLREKLVQQGIFFFDRANKFTNVQGYGQKVVATNPCGEQPLAPYSVSKGERRIGMGVMGLHDFLIYAGLRYGSPEANLLVDKLFETICLTAYETSIKLAKEKDIQKQIKTHGIRNSHLLTVAPTGSTGTLVGVSTGLEPYFAFSHYQTNSDNLPNIFVSAMELTPEEHVDIQCIIQRWIDGSISKTINAPKGYSVEQVKKIYERLYEKGAKGGTVYVDGCRDFQVLSLEKKDNQFNDLEIKKEKCKDKKSHIDIAPSGHNLSDKLREVADLVSRVKPEKHYFYKKAKARQGIEYQLKYLQ